MQFINQGTGYTNVPGSPKAIMVRLEKADFFNPATNIIRPNSIAHPDAFVPGSLESSGGALGDHNQTGYLGAECQLSLLTSMQQAGMSWISSVYIDNSQGMGTCILRHRTSGLTVTAAPSTQGHYPMLLPQGSDFDFNVSYIDPYGNNITSAPSFSIYPAQGTSYYNMAVETGYLRMQFTDVIVPPSQWNSRNLQSGLWYDYTEVIDPGDNVKLLDVNPFRKGILIANNSDDSLLQVHLRQPGSFLNVDKVITLSTFDYFMQLIPCHIGEVWLRNDNDVQPLPVSVHELV